MTTTEAEETTTAEEQRRPAVLSYPLNAAEREMMRLLASAAACSSVLDVGRLLQAVHQHALDMIILRVGAPQGEYERLGIDPVRNELLLVPRQ